MENAVVSAPWSGLGVYISYEDGNLQEKLMQFFL